MEQCDHCGDFCARPEMVECETCNSNVCERCSMSHFREHELDELSDEAEDDEDEEI